MENRMGMDSRRTHGVRAIGLGVLLALSLIVFACGEETRQNPVCIINGDCPVPADGTTWGGLKSLYR